MFQDLLLSALLTLLTKRKSQNLGKSHFLVQFFAVDTVDIVDNTEILFLEHDSNMFKYLFLLTPLALLISKN